MTRSMFPVTAALVLLGGAPVWGQAPAGGREDGPASGESGLVVASANIQSEAGRRFCVGDRNSLEVLVRRRGNYPVEAPVRVVRQKWVAPRVAGGGTSLEIPADQLSRHRMGVTFDRIRIDRADSAQGYFDLQVWEWTSATPGKSLRLDIGPNTDWSTECGTTAP